MNSVSQDEQNLKRSTPRPHIDLIINVVENLFQDLIYLIIDTIHTNFINLMTMN